jgi:hypothetical protein
VKGRGTKQVFFFFSEKVIIKPLVSNKKNIFLEGGSKDMIPKTPPMGMPLA